MSDIVERSACGKVILCGEHAVVYGRPAVALPLPTLRARACIEPSDNAFRIVAPDVQRVVSIDDTTSYPDDPLARIAQLTLRHLNQGWPCATLTVTSDIPVGANLGSGAAVSVASTRAIAAFFGHELAPADASALAFEVEKLHHGTPSGIDNTVIAFEQPVIYSKGNSSVTLHIADGFYAPPHPTLSLRGRGLLLIADTGLATPPRIPVGDVRAAWQRDPAHYETLFDDIAVVVHRARVALEAGDWPALGAAMNDNHALLQTLGVSSAELDALCIAARAAGALGAKMSGGGRGGNMIALARDAAHAVVLKAALSDAGATRVMG